MEIKKACLARMRNLTGSVSAGNTEDCAAEKVPNTSLSIVQAFCGDGWMCLGGLKMMSPVDCFCSHVLVG